MDHQALTLGIDVGSTTAKLVLLRLSARDVVVEASAYCRHEARVDDALRALLDETTGTRTDPAFVAFTGSAGMGLAERLGLPFVQEVRALCALAASRHADARTLLDIGGEDAKLVFLGPGAHVDARMNSGCAGGTGAFLDQMAALLAIDIDELDRLARSGERLHPVASRCGVFAKTDVQGLLSAGVGRADVARSVFHATAIQVLAALARGRDPETPVLVTGGPLTFLPALRLAFADVLHVEPNSLVQPERGALACAEGAALAALRRGRAMSLADVRRLVAAGTRRRPLRAGPGPLFEDEAACAAWTAARFTPVPRVAPRDAAGDLFLGVDSGSTTTKLALVDRDGRLVADAYKMNRGEPLDACRRGLETLRRAFAACHTPMVRACGSHRLRRGSRCAPRSGSIEASSRRRRICARPAPSRPMRASCSTSAART